MKLFLVALHVFLLIALPGCGQKKNSETAEQDVILKSYRLIDADRTDEAIELLERSLSEKPDHVPYRVVLASAFAHKGGFKIQKFVNLINKRNEFKRLKEVFKKQKSDPGASQSTALSIANILNGSALLFEVYANIPTLDETQAVYIRHSISILKDIGPTIAPGDALYKAVLEIVLFKHIFADQLVAEFAAPADRNEDSCRLDLARISDASLNLGKLLVDILDDLSIAKPNSVDSYKDLSAEVASSVSDVALALSAVTALEASAQLFLKQLAIQNGLGKLIKCN